MLVTSIMRTEELDEVDIAETFRISEGRIEISSSIIAAIDGTSSFEDCAEGIIADENTRWSRIWPLVLSRFIVT